MRRAAEVQRLAYRAAGVLDALEMALMECAVALDAVQEGAAADACRRAILAGLAAREAMRQAHAAATGAAAAGVAQ